MVTRKKIQSKISVYIERVIKAVDFECGIKLTKEHKKVMKFAIVDGKDADALLNLAYALQA